MPPTKRFDGGIGGGARGRRLRADDRVLAVRFIPVGDDVDARLLSEDACFKLSTCLVGEAVTYAERKCAECCHRCRSEPSAIGPQTEAGIGDEKDLFTVDDVVAILQLFRVVTGLKSCSMATTSSTVKR